MVPHPAALASLLLLLHMASLTVSGYKLGIEVDNERDGKRKWQTTAVFERRRSAAGERRKVAPYGLREIEDNDVERLSMMQKMGLSVQAALQLMTDGSPTSAPKQKITAEQLSALVKKSAEGGGLHTKPKRCYRIDRRGRHIVYRTEFYEKLGHVWLTCPQSFSETSVDEQMQHLREKGFTNHEVDIIRKLPHDRRTAIYFVVSNQTLPVRLENDQDDLTSNDFQTSEDSEGQISQLFPEDGERKGGILAVLSEWFPYMSPRHHNSRRKRARKIDLKDVVLVKTATLRYLK